MFRNYFKIAVRNLLRNKGYTLINILGLAVGLACCLLIVLYVKDELSYDKFYKNSKDIYRITADIHFNNEDMKMAVVGVPVAKAFLDEFPEVKQAVRFRQRGSFIIKYKDKGLKESKVLFADSTLFDVFSMQLLEGNPKTALSAPYSIVISQSLAKRIFGKEDPIGKTIKVDNYENYNVTGIFNDLPSNTHFQVNVFASISTLKEDLANTTWLSHNFHTYVKLHPGTRPEVITRRLPDLFKKYISLELKQFLGVTLEEMSKAGNRYTYHLQPLEDIHLHSDLKFELSTNNDIKYVYIFSIIAIIILAIACINFMNLSTARSANRAKEVGIRKVVGSQKYQLIAQFLSESVILTFVSLLLALLLVSLFLPGFNEIAQRQIGLSSFTDILTIPVMLVTVLFVGLLAGSYPAFFLSNFQPVIVLKGKFKSGKAGQFLRSGLVVCQFAISIILIISTLVVSKQLRYINNKKLGFDKNQVLIIHDSYLMGDMKKVEAFMAELLRKPEISKASVSGFLPAGPSSSGSTLYFPEGKISQEYGRSMNVSYVDHNYIPTLGIELSEGRNFSKSFKTDSATVIINEAAARSLGWKDPIGRKIARYEGLPTDPMTVSTIIGVVKDFHYKSLRDKIEPLIIHLGAWPSSVSLKIKAKDMKDVLFSVQKKWEAFAPGQPFEYSFLDERFETTYKTEQRIGDLFSIFSGLAIFIACLGLFGLATFTAEQRIKEIGIRKVLGASIPNLILLLSKEFSKLVAFAFLLAVPVAYFIMNKWLQDFEYRTEVGLLPIVFAGLMAFSIAVLTMSYQSIKTALTNPVSSLRSE